MKKYHTSKIIVLIISAVIVLALAYLNHNKLSPVTNTVSYYKEDILGRIPSLPVDLWSFETSVIPDNYLQYSRHPSIMRLKNGGYRLFGDGTDPKTRINAIYSFYLPDGLQWYFEGKVLENATNPIVFPLPDGRFRLLYSENSFNNQIIKSAISDDGLHFLKESGNRFAIGLNDFSNVHGFDHPALVSTQAGYRLYFDDDTGQATPIIRKKGNSCIVSSNGKSGNFRIYSAFSKNGKDFTFEGVRLDYTNSALPNSIGITHPTVVLVNGKFLLYATVILFNPGPNCEYGQIQKSLRADSSDGLHFTFVKELNMNGADPFVMRFGGELRMYTQGGKLSYTQKIGEQ